MSGKGRRRRRPMPAYGLEEVDVSAYDSFEELVAALWRALQLRRLRNALLAVAEVKV